VAAVATEESPFAWSSIGLAIDIGGHGTRSRSALVRFVRKRKGPVARPGLFQQLRGARSRDRAFSNSFEAILQRYYFLDMVRLLPAIPRSSPPIITSDPGSGTRYPPAELEAPETISPPL